MDAARSRRGQTATESSSVFCVSASHEGGSFFVTNLNEAHLVLSRAQRFHDPVDAVTRQTENRIDAPVDNVFNQNVRGCFCHFKSVDSIAISSRRENRPRQTSARFSRKIKLH